jgi:nucleotide-binding universal stress UspA family protein
MSNIVRSYAFRRVLVAFDGSDSSMKVVNYAVEVAKKWSASLILLTVFQRRIMPIFSNENDYETHFDPEIFERDQEAIKRVYRNLLEETASKISSENQDLEILAKFEEGRPSSVIVEVAKEEDVDLIVIGSRGLGGIKGWILGSTSQKVVNSSTKPVLIVK